MYTAGLALGLMLIPLGYYLVIEGQNIDMRLGGYFSIVAGITLFLIGWIKALREEKEAKKNNDKKFNELIEEIRGCRQALNNRTREGRNERTDKPKQ